MSEQEHSPAADDPGDDGEASLAARLWRQDRMDAETWLARIQQNGPWPGHTPGQQPPEDQDAWARARDEAERAAQASLTAYNADVDVPQTLAAVRARRAGFLLRTLRALTGLTQVELAAATARAAAADASGGRIALSRDQIGRYERGTSPPPAAAVHTLAVVWQIAPLDQEHPPTRDAPSWQPPTAELRNPLFARMPQHLTGQWESLWRWLDPDADAETDGESVRVRRLPNPPFPRDPDRLSHLLDWIRDPGSRADPLLDERTVAYLFNRHLPGDTTATVATVATITHRLTIHASAPIIAITPPTTGNTDHATAATEPVPSGSQYQYGPVTVDILAETPTASAQQPALSEVLHAVLNLLIREDPERAPALLLGLAQLSSSDRQLIEPVVASLLSARSPLEHALHRYLHPDSDEQKAIKAAATPPKPFHDPPPP